MFIDLLFLQYIFLLSAGGEAVLVERDCVNYRKDQEISGSFLSNFTTLKALNWWNDPPIELLQ